MAVLHPNSEFVIFVTHVEAEEQFLKIWGQVDKNSATYVERMILPLFEQCARERSKTQSGLTINALCCARFQNDGYYRARVCNICTDGMVVLQFIDYGNIEVLPQNEIHLLKNIPGSETLQSLPPVAVEFTLANILPINGIWDNKTIETIKKILRYNEYKASSVFLTEQHRFIKLFYNNEDFAELLIKRHMALPATLQELFRPQHVQSIQTPPYLMPNRKIINEARMINKSNPNTIFNAVPDQGVSSQNTWQNVPTPCIQPQKVVSHTPVQEALVFKSRVLDVGSKHDVYVSFVEDGPQKFSVQGQSTSEILSKLMRDINAHPTEPLQEPPLPGSVCLGRYTIDKVLCRAVVMAVMENKCKLYYVDFGHSEVLPYTDIFQLPPQYISPRVLSIRFTLSGVKELNVTPEMTEYFKKIVSGKLLVLHVRPPEGPPLIQYGDLYDNGNNVKDILRQAFSVPVAVSSAAVYQEPTKLIKDTEEIVFVSFVESCSTFFVQLDKFAKSLEYIMVCLAECAKTAPLLHPSHITIGAPCAALYDSQWYRAKILNIDGDKIRVLYIDYGNEETVNLESLRVIHNDLVTKLQAQAIKCILNGYETLPSDQECRNQFEMLVLEKRLYMKVVEVLSGGLLVNLYSPDIMDNVKNKLSHTFATNTNASSKSDSFGFEQQSAMEIPPKLQRSYIKIPLTVKHQQKNKLKNMKIIRDHTNKWKTNHEDSLQKIPIDHEHNKPKTCKNDLHGERQDNRYEKSNVFHDTSKNERISKEGYKSNKITKDESYNKRNYNDSNSSHRDGKDSRIRGRPFGNDTRFNRSSGFEKNWSDKDSDTFSRGSGKRGRGAGPNRRGRGRPRTEGVSMRLNRSRWNDNESDKDFNKSEKSSNQYNQKVQSFKDKTNYANTITKQENSSDFWDKSKKLGTSNTSLQSNEKFQLTKTNSQNMEISLLNIVMGTTKTCMTVFINSPTDFFIQLQSDCLELSSVMEKIALIYESGGEILKQSDLKPGKYCITQYSEDLKWYRAIIKVVEQQKAVVQFIDYGNTEWIDFEKIKVIQAEFLKLPIQAIHCKLLGVQNQIWPTDQIDSFANKTDGKDLEAEFVAKENNTYEIMLREVINGVPGSRYINEDFAGGVDVTKIRETALNQIKPMDLKIQPTEYDYVSPNTKWTTELHELGSCKNVIITWFTNPNNFYCQTLDKETEFRDMMNEIQKIYIQRAPITHTLQAGSPVIAIFAEDKALYRAEIIEQSKNDGYIVQYIDFGNQALVNKNNIYQVEKKLMQLPKQACHCSLKNIKPLSSLNWSEINAEAMDSCFNADKYECLFHNIENDKYIISLNNCGENITDILVSKNLASYIVTDIPKSTVESPTDLDKHVNVQQIDITLLNGQTLKVKVCNVESINKFYIQLPPGVINDNMTNKEFTMLADKQNQPVECCLLDASCFETIKDFKEIVENKEAIVYIEEVDNNRLIVKLYDLEGNKIKGQKDSDEKICPICPMPILDSTYKVIVSYADHSESIWLQRNVDYEKDVQLSQALGQYYPNSGKVLKAEIDMLCAVKGVDNYWNRAKITKLTEKSAYVNFIDYGNTQEVNIESLMELDPQFYVPHQLAVNAALTVTLNGPLSDQINVLQKELSNKTLTANFCNVNKKWMVELFDNEEKVSDKFRSLNLVKSSTEKESEINQLITGNKYNVYISHIDSPSQFWIHLSTEAKILNQKHTELQTEISTCPLVNGILEEGTICAALYSIDNMWYRAEVLDADEDITTVRFIDYGNTDVIDNKSNSIRELPEKWKEMKRYAIKSRLDIIPIDSEDWSEATCERFNNLVATTDPLEALIITDSIPKRVELFTSDKSISEILVQENHAVRIYAEQDLIDEIVELELDPHSAFVSHINSPSEFWVQEEKSITDLEVMSDRFIVADMFPKVDEIKENLLCVAKFPEDEQWYRARVISHNNGETKVIYIDYGNSAISTELRAIPEDLAKIPPLSRRCCLALPENIIAWSDEACKEFIKLAADGATIFLLDVLDVKEQEISLVRLKLNEKNVADLLANFCEKQVTDIEEKLPVITIERLPPLGEENSQSCLQAGPSFSPLTNVENGTIGAAKNSDDEKLHRTKISQEENAPYTNYEKVSHWSKETCKNIKDLAVDGATMSQSEVLDTEDPMHAKQKAKDNNSETLIMQTEEINDANINKDINESNSIELLKQKHIQEFSAIPVKETNPISNVTELSIDDIIKNMIDDTQVDNETEDFIQVKNVENNVQFYSDLKTQRILTADNNSTITCDINEVNTDAEIESSQSMLKEKDMASSVKVDQIVCSEHVSSLEKELSDCKLSDTDSNNKLANDTEITNLSITSKSQELNNIKVADIDINNALSEEQQIKCFPNRSIEEESEIIHEKYQEEEKSSCTENIDSSQKPIDTKIANNIDTDKIYTEKPKCLPNITSSEDSDSKVSKNIDSTENSLKKEKIKCLSDVSTSEELNNVEVTENDDIRKNLLEKQELTCTEKTSNLESSKTKTIIESTVKKATEETGL